MYYFLMKHIDFNQKNDINHLIEDAYIMMNNKKRTQFENYHKITASLDKNKISKPIMSKYEFNQVISLRTNQLALGGKPFVNIQDFDIKTNMDFRKIALDEMKQGKLPYIVKRQLPNGKNEYFKIKDLDLIAVQYMMI